MTKIDSNIENEERLEMTLHRPILSRNGLDKMHWSQRLRERKEWEKAIHYEGLQGRKVVPHPRPAQIRIRSYRKRFLDYDNFVGGCKPLLDALKHLNLIVDDTPDWIEVDYHQEKAFSQPSTKIEITWEESPRTHGKEK
ncbi:MAG: hypothetical protein HY538_02475 [Deltaproteobacteria bacterium]|nr:hypothetical protein [Deltaproteobacteria bacterium]